MRWSTPWPAVLLVGFVLTAGVYVVAVVDRAWGVFTARRSVGIVGIVAGPIRDAALLILTRRSATERPDSQTWLLAPAIVVAMAAAAVSAVPVARRTAVADVSDGIVLIGAAFALVMVGVYLHGWSANSPMPLIGGYRFVALALSYEMPLALVLIAAALPAQSLSVGAIIESQHDVWNVLRQPLGLPLYLIAGLGLATWGPLNMADSADLAGGTTVEVSGPNRLVWEFARRAVIVAVAVVGAAVFLGGWQGPVLPGACWMVVKSVALVVVLTAAGHRMPKLRLERFVVLAWVALIPLALVNVFVSGALAL